MKIQDAAFGWNPKQLDTCPPKYVAKVLVLDRHEVTRESFDNYMIVEDATTLDMADLPNDKALAALYRFAFGLVLHGGIDPESVHSEFKKFPAYANNCPLASLVGYVGGSEPI